MLYVGDPQVGASKGQTQGSDELVADAGAANTAARNDSFGWNRTLEIATAQNPDLNFIISAGDQVNKTGKAKEEEYAGYLDPDALASLPVATTIGNHDSLNADYDYHFNNPNETDNGMTEAGGDYYYSYGPVCSSCSTPTTTTLLSMHRPSRKQSRLTRMLHGASSPSTRISMALVMTTRTRTA